VADAHLRPVVARESQPVHAGSASSAQPQHTARREEHAPAKAAAAGTAVARKPAATPAAAKTAAAKTAPAHPDNGKAHKPDAKKDAQPEAHP